MREKELRLALVCYGGVSLAVYMHGVTKEIWRLTKASRDFVSGASTESSIYQEILEAAATETGLRLRVLPDVIAGASAGGINGIFLAQAIETGQSLEPLTDLWLSCADADILLDPDARPLSRFTKFWAMPIAWLLLRGPNSSVSRTVAKETRAEVRRKLSNFIRARWFAPPFGGKGFCSLLLNAFDAMAKGEHGKALLPPGHPLDLYVTATNFSGYAAISRLNSPPEIIETKHRLSIGFRVDGQHPRSLADAAELVFAARATASFPGAFPPFNVRELDALLAERGRAWPRRDAFLKRILPGHNATGNVEDTVLIDGSVLTNAPFAPAIEALRDRPARVPVDRRFVYIEPSPSAPGFRLTSPATDPKTGDPSLPGFFRTIFGAISDIPRAQPIRDNLEAIAERSARIRRMQQVIDGLRPEIDRLVDKTVGRTLFLSWPNARRLAIWRARLQQKAARAAGFTYSAYGYLKYAGIVDELAGLLSASSAQDSPLHRESLAETFRSSLRNAQVDIMSDGTSDPASPALIAFFRAHDIGFRVRRLRFLTRRLALIQEASEPQEESANGPRSVMQAMLYDAISLYTERQTSHWFRNELYSISDLAIRDPLEALASIANSRNLEQLDQEVDHLFASAAMALAPDDRRAMLKAYLGYPFFDIATLPLLQGEGLDEYDPIKVDRISPEDAQAIRRGGAAATLRGIEFNSFGAFFSRAYRENDYLWGRLHGADRLIDILLSTMPAEIADDLDRMSAWKRRIFHAILNEEEPRLLLIGSQIAVIRDEINQAYTPS
jgi:patatin-related protein